MGEVEGVIRRTLHKLAGQALAAYATTQRSKWILEWPGQLVLNCSQASPAFMPALTSAVTPAAAPAFNLALSPAFTSAVSPAVFPAVPLAVAPAANPSVCLLSALLDPALCKSHS